jgi:drug/metabolite transporter (DMT)-like permease
MADQLTSRRMAFGTMLVMFSGIFWAAYAVVVKIGVDYGLSEIEINTARLVVSAVVIGAYLLARRRFFFRVSAGEIVILMSLGAIDYGVGGLLYIGSLRYIDAALAFLLVYTFPAMVTLISIFTGREKPRPSLLVAVVMTFVGVAMVLEVGLAVQGIKWLGVGMVLLSALIFSVYLVFCEGLMDRLSSAQISFLTLGAGGLLMLLLLPLSGLRTDVLLEPRNLSVLLFLSVFGTAISMILFFMGVRRIGAARASIVTTAEPVFAVLLAWLLLNETLSLLQLAGVALQVSGVLLVQLRTPAVEPGP